MSNVGVNSRTDAGLKRLLSPSCRPTGVAEPNPRGVNAGALAACEENVGFLLPMPAGVNEGESTFSDFLDISELELFLF
jgi:hypothetical protein